MHIWTISQFHFPHIASFRFMICCDGCHQWFHSHCVGMSETQDWKIERKEQEHMCPTCSSDKQSHMQFESLLLPDPDLLFPECLLLNPPEVELVQPEEQPILKVWIYFRWFLIPRWLAECSYKKMSKTVQLDIRGR